MRRILPVAFIAALAGCATAPPVTGADGMCHFVQKVLIVEDPAQLGTASERRPASRARRHSKAGAGAVGRQPERCVRRRLPRPLGRTQPRRQAARVRPRHRHQHRRDPGHLGVHRGTRNRGPRIRYLARIRAARRLPQAGKGRKTGVRRGADAPAQKQPGRSRSAARQAARGDRPANPGESGPSPGPAGDRRGRARYRPVRQLRHEGDGRARHTPGQQPGALRAFAQLLCRGDHGLFLGAARRAAGVHRQPHVHRRRRPARGLCRLSRRAEAGSGRNRGLCRSQHAGPAVRPPARCAKAVHPDQRHPAGRGALRQARRGPLRRRRRPLPIRSTTATARTRSGTSPRSPCARATSW